MIPYGAIIELKKVPNSTITKNQIKINITRFILLYVKYLKNKKSIKLTVELGKLVYHI